MQGRQVGGGALATATAKDERANNTINAALFSIRVFSLFTKVTMVLKYTGAYGDGGVWLRFSKFGTAVNLR